MRPLTKDRRADFPEVPPLPVHDPHDTAPLSPLSQSSSGYFSGSASTVNLSDVLQTSSSSSSLLAADAKSPATPQQQQGADGTDLMTSPSQRPAETAPRSTASHNGDPAENFRPEHDSGRGGGALERLEVVVRAEEQSPDSQALPGWLAEGASVSVGSSKAGTVRYIGATQFAEGVWVGVELDTPVGRCQPHLRFKNTHCEGKPNDFHYTPSMNDL